MKSLERRSLSLDPDLYLALVRKAEATGRTISELVDEAVELSLNEDAEDLDAFFQRSCEPVLSFEQVVEDLRRRGRI